MADFAAFGVLVWARLNQNTNLGIKLEDGGPKLLQSFLLHQIFLLNTVKEQCCELSCTMMAPMTTCLVHVEVHRHSNFIPEPHR